MVEQLLAGERARDLVATLQVHMRPLQAVESNQLPRWAETNLRRLQDLVDQAPRLKEEILKELPGGFENGREVSGRSGPDCVGA